jgi:Haem-NO-binding
MHGLINRSLECFIRDTYGGAKWADIASAAQLGIGGFESLMSYPDALTYQVLDAACETLDKPREVFLEDMGTYLCSHPNLEAVRRLLRFGGETFVDFLYSLDDLPDRARLAVPDLALPKLELRDHSGGVLTLRCSGEIAGFGHVLVGVLCAMADDYGTLAMFEHMGAQGGGEMVQVQLLEAQFSRGKEFHLAPGAS